MAYIHIEFDVTENKYSPKNIERVVLSVELDDEYLLKDAGALSQLIFQQVRLAIKKYEKQQKEENTEE